MFCLHIKSLVERLGVTIAEMFPGDSLGEEHFSLLNMKNDESWKCKKMANLSAWGRSRKKVMAIIYRK